MRRIKERSIEFLLTLLPSQDLQNILNKERKNE